MDLRQLGFLVGVIDAGSVSRAAQALHIAQPALSQQIARLEADLGVQLLNRSVRGVTPTDAGAAVCQQARLILRQVEATRLIARSADGGLAGPVTLGLPSTITTMLGLLLLKAVRAQLPAVRLEVTEGPSVMLSALLAQGRLDLAIVFDAVVDSGLLLSPVCSEALLLVGPPGAGGEWSGATVSDIATLPLLLLGRPNGIRELLERAWGAAGVEPNIVAEVNASHLLVQAVEAGVGWSVLPACGIEDALQAGRLDALPLEAGRFRRTVYLGTSRLFVPGPAAVAVLNLLQGLIREAVRTGAWHATMLNDGNGPDIGAPGD